MSRQHPYIIANTLNTLPLKVRHVKNQPCVLSRFTCCMQSASLIHGIPPLRIYSSHKCHRVRSRILNTLSENSASAKLSRWHAADKANMLTKDSPWSEIHSVKAAAIALMSKLYRGTHKAAYSTLRQCLQAKWVSLRFCLGRGWAWDTGFTSKNAFSFVEHSQTYKQLFHVQVFFTSFAICTLIFESNWLFLRTTTN